MNGRKQIRHLVRKEIDEAKWDECIDSAGNGLIYGYSFYLDAMTTHWDALVLNDYEALMPLPWRRKWGVSYLYQPFLTAQLGVFGKNISPDLLTAFLGTIPKKFRYWDFPLNYQNLFPLAGFPLYERMNYVLPLEKQHEELWKGYRENIRRNIKNCRDNECTVQKDTAIDAVIALAELQTEISSRKDLDAFKTLFLQLQKQGMARTYGILSKTGDLLASAAFLFSHNRAFYILVGNHPASRKLGASHALIDAFIRDHAGKNLLLDFEGSDIQSLAFFYSSFGAREEKYAAVKWNRLPRWVKTVANW
jgi:hypothetical protein